MLRIGALAAASLLVTVSFAACSSNASDTDTEICHGGCLCFGNDLEGCAANGCYPTFPLDGGPGGCGGGPVMCGLGEIATGKPPPNCGILTATNSPIAVVMMDGGFCCENPYADAGVDAADASTDAAPE